MKPSGGRFGRWSPIWIKVPNIESMAGMFEGTAGYCTGCKNRPLALGPNLKF